MDSVFWILVKCQCIHSIKTIYEEKTKVKIPNYYIKISIPWLTSENLFV